MEVQARCGSRNTNALPMITEADAVGGMVQRFRILSLPPELRELIYYYAMAPLPPIDTAAIPGTPNRVVIPAIAQVSRLLRKEALSVFYRHRPVEISLHCDENVRRALKWAKAWDGHSKGFATVVFTGRLAEAKNEFFHITVESSKSAPYFATHSRPGASEKACKIVARMAGRLQERLKTAGRRTSEEDRGRLTGEQLTALISHVQADSTLLPE